MLCCSNLGLPSVEDVFHLFPIIQFELNLLFTKLDYLRVVKCPPEAGHPALLMLIAYCI